MSIPFRRHSPTAQAAYADLLTLLRDDALSDITGSPTLREKNGRGYWYDRYRVGTTIKERYLGEDSPELRSRIDRHASIKRESADRRNERGRLVRLLRSEGFIGLDNASGSLIAALARVGVFRLGGTLVGTQGFRAFEGELGIRLTLDQAAATQDIDIASFEKLSLAIGDVVTTPIDEVLRDFEFGPVPSLDRGKVWSWRQSRGQIRVEFLTPSFDDEEGIQPLPALGVAAQSLHFLDFVLAEPIWAAAVYRDGALFRVPRPERFAIHKLIVADRRLEGPESLKARKDLDQAVLLMQVLAEDRPRDLAAAYLDAIGRGPRWRQRIQRTLKRSPEAARLIEAVAG